jgi:ribosomal protein S12 methylthiotransferase
MSTTSSSPTLMTTPDATLPPVQARTPQKISFVHLGCPKNLVDTENMLGLLEQAGHTIVQDETEADIVMVNTCAFIDKAQQESVGVLANLAEGGKRLLITGCLAQKFQGELLDLFPEADAVVGIDNVPQIAKIMERVGQGERVLAVQQDPHYILEEDNVRRHVTVGSYVYVKIAEGCDYACSFCIIPSMRGTFRSRTLQNIVDNVTQLVDKGATEIVLVGQDTTSYGKDIGESLPKLLRALNAIEGLQWIRFMYAYPNLVTDELLDTIAQCDKVVKYLDCPLQHSHPEVLRRMRRPVMDIAALAQRMRDRIPGVRLRTSFIVGFPGETQEHFEHLRDTIQAVKWDRMGVFEYSDVDTAHSQGLDEKVAKKVITQRRSELMAIQQGISYEHNMALVGQTLPVLIETINQFGVATARTQWDAPEVDNSVMVKAQANQALVPGDIVMATITGATPYDLKAKAQTF